MPRPHRHIREAIRALPGTLDPHVPYCYIVVRGVCHVVRDSHAPFDAICGNRNQILEPRTALRRTLPDGRWCPGCAEILTTYLHNEAHKHD